MILGGGYEPVQAIQRPVFNRAVEVVQEGSENIWQFLEKQPAGVLLIIAALCGVIAGIALAIKLKLRGR